MVLAVGLLLGRLGPFGTFGDLPPTERYGYWIGLTLLVWLQAEAALHLLRGLPRATRLPWTARAVLAGAIGAVPGAFEVAWAESLLRVRRDLGLVDLLAIYGDVALIGAGLALLVDWPRYRPAGAAPPAATAEPLPPLLDLVPPERRGELLALEAEDHYLRIYTSRGDTLVHRRLGEAVAEVAGIEGARVHRSWWVARAAVAASERDGDRLVLVLTNGLRVPISRTFLIGARDAGLVLR
jgi:hypothetical protein